MQQSNKGRVVRSLAGRDKGSFLVVISQAEGLMWVCDGKERPLVRPKKKNPLHLAVTGTYLSEDEMATDRKLRAALAKIGARTTEEVI